MKGVKVKGNKMDTVFVVTFAEIMGTKMSPREKVDALNKLYKKVNDSLTIRLFK